MDVKEAKEILSDMRDQHLQFIDGAENTWTWGEKFLKEAETYYLATPSLQKMYSADDGNTEVFYFKNATATFSSFTHEPEVVKL